MPLNLNNQGIESGQLFIYTHLESGKKAALPLLPPLRTVRAIFPAHGSSLFKAPL
jgi:hypothetical protein